MPYKDKHDAGRIIVVLSIPAGDMFEDYKYYDQIKIDVDKMGLAAEILSMSRLMETPNLDEERI